MSKQAKSNKALYTDLAHKMEAKYGLPADSLVNLVRQESGFNPFAKSPVGALGLGQLMPSTARNLGVKNPLDPVQNLDGAARLLKQNLRQYGDLKVAYAAYNGGGDGAKFAQSGFDPKVGAFIHSKRKKQGSFFDYNQVSNYVKSITGSVSKGSPTPKNSSSRVRSASSVLNPTAIAAGAPQNFSPSVGENFKRGLLDSLTFGNAPTFSGIDRTYMDYQTAQSGGLGVAANLAGNLVGDVGVGAALGGGLATLGKIAGKTRQLQALMKTVKQSEALQKLGRLPQANKIANFVGSRASDMATGAIVETSQFGRMQQQDIQRGTRDGFNFGALGAAAITGAATGLVPTLQGTTKSISRAKNALAGAASNLASDAVQLTVDSQYQYSPQDAALSVGVGGFFGGLRSKVRGQQVDVPTQAPSQEPAPRNFVVSPDGVVVNTDPTAPSGSNLAIRPSNQNALVPVRPAQQAQPVGGFRGSSVDFPLAIRESTDIVPVRPAPLATVPNTSPRTESGVLNLPKMDIDGEFLPYKPNQRLKNSPASEVLSNVGYKGFPIGEKERFNLGGKVGTLDVSPEITLGQVSDSLRRSKNVDVVGSVKKKAAKSGVDLEASKPRDEKSLLTELNKRNELKNEKPISRDLDFDTDGSYSSFANRVQRNVDRTTDLSEAADLSKRVNASKGFGELTPAQQKQIKKQLSNNEAFLKQVKSKKLKPTVQKPVEKAPQPTQEKIVEKTTGEAPEIALEKSVESDKKPEVKIEKSSDKVKTKEDAEALLKKVVKDDNDTVSSVVETEERFKRSYPRSEKHQEVFSEKVKQETPEKTFRLIESGKDESGAELKPLPDNPVALKKTKENLKFIQDNIGSVLDLTYTAELKGFSQGQVDLGANSKRSFQFIPQHVFQIKNPSSFSDGGVRVAGVSKVGDNPPKKEILALNDFYKSHKPIKKYRNRAKTKETQKNYGSRKGGDQDGFSAILDVKKSDVSLSEFVKSTGEEFSSDAIRASSVTPFARKQVEKTLKQFAPRITKEELDSVLQTFDLYDKIDIVSLLNTKGNLNSDFIAKHKSMFSDLLEKMEQLGYDTKKMSALRKFLAGSDKAQQKVAKILGC